MSADDFKTWLTRMRLTKIAAAQQLGVSRNTITKFCNGKVAIPSSIGFACAAMIRGIPAWPN